MFIILQKIVKTHHNMAFIGKTSVSPLSTYKEEVGGEHQKKKNKSSFIPVQPNWDLEEIVLQDNTKKILQDVIIFCKHKDKIVTDWNLKRFLKGSGGCIGINMYGKPGTGKSIAAEAIAKSIQKKIIRVDYSEIQNEKWGGTEKKLSELFETAKDTDSIIFFDESDGLLSKRQSNGANAETNNQIKSHLLTLLDQTNAIVIFATNLFENYDRAFFRRILFHIKFSLPTEQELIKLWKFHLGCETENKFVPRCANFSFEKLAKVSIGLSGGDIKNLTLRTCILLFSRNIQYITNEMISDEIEEYKQSLLDMDSKNSSYKVEKLLGEEAEQAKELLINKKEEN